MNYKIELELNETEIKNLLFALAAYELPDIIKNESVWPIYDKIVVQKKTQKEFVQMAAQAKNERRSFLSFINQYADLVDDPALQDEDSWDDDRDGLCGAINHHPDLESVFGT